MTQGQRMVDNLDEDIRDHITRETEDNIARGMAPADARSAALRAFGNVMRVKEDTHAVWISVWLEQLGQDVRFALRLLRTTPGFTVAAVMTVALAIGANALVFAVFDVFVVHPPDLPQAQSLYTLERGKDKSTFQSYPDYLDLRDRNRSFDGLAAFAVTADLNAIGADLERRFPKDDGQMTLRWRVPLWACRRSVRLFSHVYQATARHPLVMAGVVLAMCSLGVLTTWIPAQRALAIDPMILMRDA